MTYLMDCGHPDKGDCDAYCTAEREQAALEPWADRDDSTLACGHRWTGSVWNPVCEQGCPPPPEDLDDGLSLAPSWPEA
ncbi:hypothetical protein [Streptomyces sp. NPDC020983]|uniref:hypothetical protein n=1 Tax=Streptomyces sp. NPDC020983 TaxID=3365106 RepID=UPI0037ACB1B5